jgi:hypothetical protein
MYGMHWREDEKASRSSIAVEELYLWMVIK